MKASLLFFAFLILLLSLLNPVVAGGADDDDDEDEITDKAPAPPEIFGASPRSLTSEDFVDGFYDSPLSSSSSILLPLSTTVMATLIAFI